MRKGPERRRGTTGRAPVLVVEDEPAVRTLVRRVLGAGGYDVTPARTGRDALAELDRLGVVPALVLTDVMMPVMMPLMTGPQLVAALRARGSDGRAVDMSGGAAGPELAEALRAPDAHRLPKPLPRDQLVKAVRGAAVPTAGTP